MSDKLNGSAYGASAFMVWVGTLNWPVISMILGCILGIATFGLNWYYKHRNSKLYEEATKRGYLDEPKGNPEE